MRRAAWRMEIDLQEQRDLQEAREVQDATRTRRERLQRIGIERERLLRSAASSCEEARDADTASGLVRAARQLSDHAAALTACGIEWMEVAP